MSHRELRKADLNSGIGAGLLGMGLGVFLYRYIKEHYIAFLIVGLVLHSLGMYKKQKVQSAQKYPTIWWSTFLYWICWLTLLVIGSIIIINIFL